ncbi:MAG: phosphatase [Fibrobacter sp.]|jgi:exopolyphosphatase/guanosine-5'-triphosphate,3'-diphosphate pyrophosphatase|nr:phosphatase [Fibrobacter sp.]
MKMLPAVVTIGNGTSALVIADRITENGVQKLKPCIQKYEPVSPKSEAFGMVLEDFRARAHALGAEIEIAAVPSALFTEELAGLIEKKLWIEPQIISADDERALIFSALAERYGEGIVSLNIGEKTTELCSAKKNLSLPAGFELLFEQMGPIPGPEYKNWSKELFKEYPVKPYAKMPVFLAGDLARAFVKVLFNSPRDHLEKMEGFEVDLPTLEQTITRISNLSLELRASLPGLENGRHRTILCGLFLLRSLFEKLRAESFQISLTGIHSGLLYRIQEKQ